MLDELSEALICHLLFCLRHRSLDIPAENLRWVMNEEWFQEVRRFCDSDGRELWEPPASRLGQFGYLYGIRVIVREGGGVPHLEAWG